MSRSSLNRPQNSCWTLPQPPKIANQGSKNSKMMPKLSKNKYQNWRKHTKWTSTQLHLNLTSTSASNQPQPPINLNLNINLNFNHNLNSIWLWHKSNPILSFLKTKFSDSFCIWMNPKDQSVTLHLCNADKKSIVNFFYLPFSIW